VWTFRNNPHTPPALGTLSAAASARHSPCIVSPQDAGRPSPQTRLLLCGLAPPTRARSRHIIRAPRSHEPTRSRRVRHLRPKRQHRAGLLDVPPPSQSREPRVQDSSCTPCVHPRDTVRAARSNQTAQRRRAAPDRPARLIVITQPYPSRDHTETRQSATPRRSPQTHKENTPPQTRRGVSLFSVRTQRAK
jgi:hypothetical protein